MPLDTVCPRYSEEATEECIEYDDACCNKEGHCVIKTKDGIEQLATRYEA